MKSITIKFETAKWLLPVLERELAGNFRLTPQRAAIAWSQPGEPLNKPRIIEYRVDLTDRAVTWLELKYPELLK